MSFKRTEFIKELESSITVGTGVHQTGRYTYFRNQVGGPLCRMTNTDYTEYKRIRQQTSGEKFFWAHVEFVEVKDDVL